jgi:hypothetical protein
MELGDTFASGCLNKIIHQEFADASTLLVGSDKELRRAVFGCFLTAEIGRGTAGNDLVVRLNHKDLLPFHLALDTVCRDLAPELRDDRRRMILKQYLIPIAKDQLGNDRDVLFFDRSDCHASFSRRK